MLSWHVWVRFRGLEPGGQAAGRRRGRRTIFPGCVLGEDGEFCHAIPHRYRCRPRTARAWLQWARQGGTRRVIAHKGTRHADPQEIKRYNELGARGLSFNLLPLALCRGCFERCRASPAPWTQAVARDLGCRCEGRQIVSIGRGQAQKGLPHILSDSSH
jgi:hypothetical protein